MYTFAPSKINAKQWVLDAVLGIELGVFRLSCIPRSFFFIVTQHLTYQVALLGLSSNFDPLASDTQCWDYGVHQYIQLKCFCFSWNKNLFAQSVTEFCMTEAGLNAILQTAHRVKVFNQSYQLVQTAIDCCPPKTDFCRGTISILKRKYNKD